MLSTDHTLLKVAEMLVQLGLSQRRRTYPKPRQIYDFNETATLSTLTHFPEGRVRG